MSGFIGGAAGPLVGNALALAGSALGGSGVTIGAVTLSGFEVPDVVPWGTEQLIKEHVYPGGLNILQVMGPTREPISWSGQMIGPDATIRAQQLDQMAAAGQPVQIAWGSLNFTGVIKRFKGDYKHEWQGRYSISIQVQWDYSDPQAPPDPVASVLADLQTAVSYVPTILSVATALTGVNGVKQGASSTGTLQATAGQIRAAQAAIGQSAAASGSILAAGAPSPTTISALAAAAANTAECAAAFGFTSRACNNWQQVPGISTPNSAPQQNLADLSQYPGA